VHGCSVALEALLGAIQPGRADTLVFLGDYIDRGSDSRGVIDMMIELSSRCRLLPLAGNHEEMLLRALTNLDVARMWLAAGGMQCLRSYGWFPGKQQHGSLADLLPTGHLWFMQRCYLYHETATHIF